MTERRRTFCPTSYTETHTNRAALKFLRDTDLTEQRQSRKWRTINVLGGDDRTRAETHYGSPALSRYTVTPSKNCRHHPKTFLIGPFTFDRAHFRKLTAREILVFLTTRVRRGHFAYARLFFSRCETCKLSVKSNFICTHTHHLACHSF